MTVDLLVADAIGRTTSDCNLRVLAADILANVCMCMNPKTSQY